MLFPWMWFHLCYNEIFDHPAISTIPKQRRLGNHYSTCWIIQLIWLNEILLSIPSRMLKISKDMDIVNEIRKLFRVYGVNLIYENTGARVFHFAKWPLNDTVCSH